MKEKTANTIWIGISLVFMVAIIVINYAGYNNFTGDDAFDGTYSECIAWKADMARLYPGATSSGCWTNPIRNHVQPKES